MKRLEGRVAVITGTGKGMGRAAALRFAQEGARVVGCDLDAEASEAVVREVRAAGGVMSATAPVDLGDPEAARSWIAKVNAEEGRIDILYNNASACRFVTIAKMTDEDWAFTVRNELDLVAHVTRAAWPHLCRQGGVIINTASVAGHGGGVGGLGHSATKAGVIAMTRVMAAEGAPHGVRAVSISPGMIETPGSADQLAAPGVKDALMTRVKVPRVGRAEEVAALAAFLASDEAAYITGADYLVDGGLTH